MPRIGERYDDSNVVRECLQGRTFVVRLIVHVLSLVIVVSKRTPSVIM